MLMTSQLPVYGMSASSPRVGSQPLARRASAGFTPVLGAVHERSDSANSQAAELGNSSGTAEYTAGTGTAGGRSNSLWSTRRNSSLAVLPTAIRRKATRGTSRRQQAWILVICVVAVWTLLGRDRNRSGNSTGESASGGSSFVRTSRGGSNRLATACKFTPWLSRCKDSTADPFRGLKYDVRHGLLHYPAVLDDPDASRDPLNPPDQPHAIHYLIRDAQRAWQAKLDSQSTTLAEAVAEYRRRYNGQNPPRGFDVWYEFAKKHNVQLIDEYDSIRERILPYAAIPSSVLRQRSDQLQNDDKLWLRDMAFTIRIRPGADLSASGPMRHSNNRPDQVLDLLKNIAHLVPVDVNLTITGHDNPWVVMSGEAKERHVAAAKAGQYLPAREYGNPRENWDYDGWALACPPTSPIRKQPRFDERKDNWRPAYRSSLISDHEEAMNVCMHPENQPIHGFTAWPGPRPGLLYPVFSFTSSALHSDLLLPPLEQYEVAVGPDPPWGRKRLDKVIWRGSTTGSDLAIPHMRKWSQRPRLCRLHRQTGLVTVHTAAGETPNRKSLEPVETFTDQAAHFAEEYFDFKFQGAAQQCGDEKSCRELEAQFEWDTYMSPARQNEYKYVIDVDGNGWSGRFHRLMASNSLVLKSTVFPEWYADRIQPWIHYVPVNVDYADLWEIMAFFRGDLEGRGGHDHLAEQIATEGKAWTKQYWRWEDMQAYFLRLILEYARVMHKDPNNPTNMDFIP